MGVGVRPPVGRVKGGAGLDDVAGEGEAVDDGGAEPQAPVAGVDSWRRGPLSPLS